jgi:N-methylhydantoinase A/oxoprolinase/acetone carboxylase beta subunit
VGAGGGSIASVAAAGHPRLGPRSAGSVPGPACIGKGGTDPTVTDAALLAGWLNDANFAGGEIVLDKRRSSDAIEAAGLPAALQVSTEFGASTGILTLAATAIAEAIRALTVKHGEDPRECSLFVYGGAGGLFGADVAEILDMERVVQPANASVLSAWGGLLSEEEHDYVRTITGPLSGLDSTALETHRQAMVEQARLDFDTGDDGDASFDVEYSLDLRYEGQSHVLTVSIDSELTADSARIAGEMFEDQHQYLYGHRRPEDPVELVAFRMHAHRPVTPDAHESLAHSKPVAGAPNRHPDRRTVHRFGQVAAEWPIVDRTMLRPEECHVGPLIIEDASSTLVVPTGWRAIVGNLSEVNIIRGTESA